MTSVKIHLLALVIWKSIQFADVKSWREDKGQVPGGAERSFEQRIVWRSSRGAHEMMHMVWPGNGPIWIQERGVDGWQYISRYSRP